MISRLPTQTRVISIQPTTYCAHNCAHCSMPQALRKNQEIMSEKNFAAVCQFLNKLSVEGDYLRLRWVGGEPFTVQQSWYEMTEQYLKTLTVPYFEMLQTSLVLFDSTRLSFVRSRLQNKLYVSFDLFARHESGSRNDYLALWEQKIQELVANGVDFRTVTTVTPEVIKVPAAELVSVLRNYGIRTLSLVKYVSTEANQAYVTKSEHSEFLSRLFDATMAQFNARTETLGIVAFADAIRAVVFQVAHGVWEPQHCMHQRSLAITPSGEVLSCTYAHGVLGNVYDDPEKIFQTSVFKSCQHLVLQQRLKNPICRHCDFASWCQPKCHESSTPVEIRDPECPRYSKFLRHVAKFCETQSGYDRALEYLYAVEKMLVDKTPEFD